MNIGTDVRPRALCEAVHEDRTISLPEYNDRPMSSRSSLPRPRDPLLNDAATEIGIDLPSFGPCHGLH